VRLLKMDMEAPSVIALEIAGREQPAKKMSAE
jgi:hypothetical protein